MKKFVLVLGLIAISLRMGAQDYAVSLIADSLKEKAYSVIRDYNVDVHISSLKQGKVTYRMVATVLKEEGKGAADFVYFSDMFRELDHFEGELYDAEGSKLFSIKKSDLKKTNLSDELASDEKTFFYDCSREIYPFTVVYEWSVKYNRGFLSFPSFMPVTEFNQSVEKTQYTLWLPEDMKMDAKANGMKEEPVLQEVKGEIARQWKLSGIKALEHEPLGPSLGQLAPRLYVKPMNFVYDGYAGGQSTWEELSAWQHSLMDGRDQLTPELEAQIKALVKDTDSDYEKVRKLYAYLGENMRYVSIQLGIGGLQPMKATETARLGFGDCKALSFYLKVMLQLVGIESEYVVISTSNNRLYADYPNVQQMNHVILKVPLKERTLWLECTNPFLPFGYIHGDIAGHDALIVRPQKGGLERLPDYADSLHMQNNHVEVDWTDASQTNVRVIRTSYLTQYESASVLLHKKTEEQKDYIRRKLKLTRAVVGKVELSEKQDSFPTLTERYDLKAMYGNKNGNRFFVPVNPFRQEPFRVSDHNRTQDIFIGYGYMDCDTIKINLPENYVVEAQPSDVDMNCIFGRITSCIRVENGSITIVQRLYRRKGRYSFKKIDELIEFGDAIKKAYNGKIILKKMNK